MGEGRLGLCRNARLRKRWEFFQVYGRGEKEHAAYFVLYLLENELSRHRLGVTASRKVGKAIKRNQIRRRLREVFRRNREIIPPWWDVVINVKQAAGGASLKDLRNDFIRAIGRWKRRAAGA